MSLVNRLSWSHQAFQKRSEREELFPILQMWSLNFEHWQQHVNTKDTVMNKPTTKDAIKDPTKNRHTTTMFIQGYFPSSITYGLIVIVCRLIVKRVIGSI